VQLEGFILGVELVPDDCGNGRAVRATGVWVVALFLSELSQEGG
jgi:hypothetical protein